MVGDFTKSGERRGILLEGWAMCNKTVNRRLPFNTELLEFGRMRLGIDTEQRGLEFNPSWEATLIGVMFLLRASELAALEIRDVTFVGHEGVEYVRIFIRKSKHDQEELGAFRRLNATKQRLCPVAWMRYWVARIATQPRDTPSFGSGILQEVTHLIKWTAAGRNLPPNRFPIHSLRAVGDTCLHRAGADLEFIRRFGRWKSIAFSIYLHFDGQIIGNISSCLMRSEGLTTQLKVFPEGTHRTDFEREVAATGWKSPHLEERRRSVSVSRQPPARINGLEATDGIMSREGRSLFPNRKNRRAMAGIAGAGDRKTGETITHGETGNHVAQVGGKSPAPTSEIIADKPRRKDEGVVRCPALLTK